MSLADMINEGVRRAYNHPDNKLRASIVADPAFDRKNTRDNTPAVIHMEVVPGDELEIAVAAKGGGSENKAALTMLNPSDSIVDWILETVPEMGAGWCPPGMLGIGIGGTAEKAMVLAKESLFEPIDIHEVRARGPQNRIEALRLEILDKVNALGIGAQGLGGLTTVLDVKIKDYPTHAASLPVAIIPNCAATRHAHFVLDGSGPAQLDPPDLELWPKLTYQASRRLAARESRRADARRRRRRGGRASACCCRARCSRAATLRTSGSRSCIEAGKPLPDGLDFKNRVIYYVGPVDPVKGEAVGPAGPTTATRMDKFTEMMLGAHRADRDGRQGRARPRGDRGDPQAQGRVSRWPSAARRISYPRRSAPAASSRSATSAWKRSTSSR